MEQNGKAITAKILRHKFLGMDEEDRKTLVAFFNEHNEQCRKLIGIDYVDITIRRYECCSRYLQELIREKYGEDDLLLREVNGEFVRSFEFYMKTEKKCQQNTVIRYMKCFKKVINLAIANEYITRNPFAGIKFHEVAVNKEFLTMEEINRMAEKEFTIQRLELVRDVFLFCIYSGLAFIDVYNLRKEHIVSDNEGNLWIRKTREKTNNMCNIPLLSKPIEILQKYENHPVCLEKGVLLPVMCNQRMNSYLKELADLCGIKKTLTTHVARYTFASVIALAKNDTVGLTKIIDKGTAESFACDEFYETSLEHLSQFKYLLKKCLEAKLHKLKINWIKEESLFAFIPTQKDEEGRWMPRNVSWSKTNKKATRKVVDVKRDLKNKDDVFNLKCLSFRSKFEFFDDEWFLAIKPEWVFLWPSFKVCSLAFKSIQWLKKTERNMHVFNHFNFILKYLQPSDSSLFSEFGDYPFLKIGEIEKFDFAPIVVDDSWINLEDPDGKKKLTDNSGNIGLLGV